MLSWRVHLRNSTGAILEHRQAGIFARACGLNVDAGALFWMSRLIALIVLCLLALQPVRAHGEEIVKTTICQVIASPPAFDHKLIELSGYASEAIGTLRALGEGLPRYERQHDGHLVGVRWAATIGGKVLLWKINRSNTWTPNGTMHNDALRYGVGCG
jgi:hypothetical protein